MYRFLAILLLCALAAGAQTTPTPATPQPAVNLNDSDNARQARAVLDKTIEALGGQPYLTYENRVEEGRYYPLYHGRTESTGIPYRYYLEYPDRDRFEVLHTKDIHVLPGMIDIGGVKVEHKFDLALIHNGDKGYEITYKGTAAQDKLDLENFLRRRQHSLHRLMHRFMAKSKCAVMHGQKSLRPAMVRHHPHLLRRRMSRNVRVVCSNPHDRQIHRSDVLKIFLIRRVTGIQNPPAR